MIHQFEFREDTYLVDCTNLSSEKVGAKKGFGAAVPASNTADSKSENEECCIKTIELLISQKCNLACTYCYADGGEYSAPGRMLFDTAAKAVDFLVHNSGPKNNLSITFFGGEPLIEFESIKKIVRYAQDLAASRGKVVSFSITTNGLMLDNEKISFFRDNSVDVMVSVDGDKEAHDRHRPLKNGEGSANLIFPRIAELLETLPDSPARATIVDSFRTPKEIKRSLHELGFRNTGLSVASGTLFDDVGVRTVSSQGMAELIEEEAASLLHLITQRDIEGLSNFDSAIVHYVSDFLAGRKSYYPCGAGRQMLAVSAEGDLFPCHRFVGIRKYRVGNIHDKSNVSLPVFEGSPVELSGECSMCFAKNLCGGACYHDSITSTGSLLQPNPNFCATVRRTFEMAAFVVANLSSEDRFFFEEGLNKDRGQCKLDFF